MSWLKILLQLAALHLTAYPLKALLKSHANAFFQAGRGSQSDEAGPAVDMLNSEKVEGLK